MRHSQTLRMEPTPPEHAAVYRRRGLIPPDAASDFPGAAVWPYRPRLLHRLYARAHGLFWIPCVLCEREFGGHEIVDSVPDPTDDSELLHMSICPVCTAERNGGDA